MAIWAILIGLCLFVEFLAISTKEKYFPTLSRTCWRLFRFEDKSYDRNEKIVRWIVAIILTLFFAWVVIHIAFGPCAFGWC